MTALSGKTFHDGYTPVDFIEAVLKRHELDTLNELSKESH